MPMYRSVAFELDVSRRAVLLDTNVLVSAFLPDDEMYEDANVFLDLLNEQIIVPVAVLIETWGMIVGSRKAWDSGFKFLAWLSNPGNAILIVQDVSHFGNVRELTQSLHVDCIDAFLSCLAHEISKQCNLIPPIRIATYDTADFAKCALRDGLRIGLIDPNSGDEYSF